MDTIQVRTAVDRLHEALHPAGARTVGQTVEVAGTVIANLLGLTQLHRYATPSTAHEANQLRNVLLACLAGYAHVLGHCPRITTPLVPAVMPRGTSGRPAADDEILLLRLFAISDAERGGRAQSRALSYVLVEAGARTGETTAVRFSDLDDIRHPTTVSLPGNRVVKARTVPIPTWARPPVALILSRLLAHSDEVPTRPLAYTGNQTPGGPAASASACGMLRNHLRDSGLDIKTLDPGDIGRWRVGQVRRTQTLHAARAVHGGRSLDAVVAYTRNAVDPTPAPPQAVDLDRYAPFPAEEL